MKGKQEGCPHIYSGVRVYGGGCKMSIHVLQCKKRGEEEREAVR